MWALNSTVKSVQYKQRTDKVHADIDLANIFKIFQSTICWWCTWFFSFEILKTGETSAYTFKTSAFIISTQFLW